MLAEIKEEIAKFEELQKEFKDYGAGDMTPDGLFQTCLLGALKGHDLGSIPSSAAEWGLVKDAGVGIAVQKLADRTRRICSLILKTTLADQAEVNDYLVEYCWRIK